ncbi:hypothetical protein AB6A40_010161 [Gnathostoma spinigerum]|uniref:Coronin n=1 Tax=Gnathostoma spinigerum TaxID=75299 RepID=A0ABD6F273_9BILA
MFAILQLSPVRRLPDGVIDCIQNHSGLTDFVWDPFNPNRLACALENGFIKFWVIPDEPVKLVSLVPIKEMQASYEKIVAIKFHPFASDVIAVACIGGTISIWDCLNTECRWKVLAHVGGILSMAWCFDGTKIVSVGRDQSLKVWLPRERTDCVIEHPGIIESVRSARAIFVCNGKFIILVHFQNKFTIKTPTR